MRRFIYLFAASFLLLSFSANKKNISSFKLIFQPVFNSKPLQLNTQAYINAHNDTLFIDELKFYISNIKLVSNTNKKFEEKNSYHLIDVEDSSTQIIKLQNVADDNYNELHFLIGTDSLANVSGALSGDLDPIKGMYWAWNTGYINAKLTGHSKVCKTLHQAFEFHIGGYIPPYKTVREVVLPITTTQIKTGFITVNVDIAKWLSDVDLAKLNNVVIPGKDAVAMADKYKNMFSVAQ